MSETQAQIRTGDGDPSCPRCGTHLSASISPGGLCPKCLLEIGLGAGAGEAPAEEPEQPLDVPPPGELSLEQLAPLFPQFELLGVLGRGGMGTVYKARQKGLDRMIALKIMPAGAAKDPTWPDRFGREARALARLSHPNIVTVYDSGEVEGLYFFAMEFVDGANLRQVIRAQETTTKAALKIVTQVCEALQFAHDEGIVHRDIKPENILVDTRGRVRIADFGLAKLLGSDQEGTALTRTQQAMGTPHYMAPEQWEQPLTVDHRADIYALGVVFYELLTGELPLGRFAPPSHKVAMDIKLDEVVLKTLAKEPELRYQRASEVQTDIEGVAERAEEEQRSQATSSEPGTFEKVKRVLDPRTPGTKHIGEVEFSNKWLPLGITGFLAVTAYLAITASAPVLLAGLALAGIIWFLRNLR